MRSGWGKSSLENSPVEGLLAKFRSWRLLEARARAATKSEMLETALEQMLRRHLPDAFRVSHYIDQSTHFATSMSNGHSRNAKSNHFLRELSDIPKNDPIGVKFFDRGATCSFESARLPIKRPWSVMMGVARDPFQQLPARRSGGFNEQEDFEVPFHAVTAYALPGH